MKALTELKEKASQFVSQRFGQINDVQRISNEISNYALVELEEKWNAANIAFYDSPSVPAFKALAKAKQEKELAVRVWQEVSTSVGLHKTSELTGEDSREDLTKALTTYAADIAAKIEQIENDARELASRAGIDYFEPSPVTTLRAELERANEGIGHVNNPDADPASVWRAFSPMVRPASKATAS